MALLAIAAAIGGQYLASRNSKKAAQKAADAEQQAAERNIAFQKEVLEQTRKDLSPYRDFGGAALPKLSQMLGINQQFQQNQQNTDIDSRRKDFEEYKTGNITKEEFIQKQPEFQDFLAFKYQQSAQPDPEQLKRSAALLQPNKFITGLVQNNPALMSQLQQFQNQQNPLTFAPQAQPQFYNLQNPQLQRLPQAQPAKIFGPQPRQRY